MTGDALKRECQYEVVMYQVKRMLHAGIITEHEFQEIEARFRAKYKPVKMKFPFFSTSAEPVRFSSV